ncbi:MAG TPA: hypothetical protein VFD75_13735 [Pyrinomonadaceae bacterium]|nr:hypothetical protein [Pyrinomonadaceae bacterium]
MKLPARKTVLSIAPVVLMFLSGSVVLAQNAPQTHPIVELKQQCVLGGVRNQRWVAAERIPKSLKPKQKLKLYTLAGPAGDFTIDKISSDDCGGESVESTSKAAEGVALAAPTWEVMPRTPRPVDPKDTTYTKVIADILIANGIRKPEVEINQGYKIDLDGDGKDEVVIIASHFKQGVGELTGIGHGTATGDYALVLVRKIVNEQVRNIFIIKDIRRGRNEGPLVRGYHLSAIADLNGDGVMELVLYDAYHEGSASHVVEIKRVKANFVLNCACEH